jgi:asparagine synthase (glutamine-hydrolysing)
LAKAICKATNTTWIPVQADTNNMLDEFERFLKHIGEPFSNMTMFAQYQVMQLAAKNGLKVMIDGQGGDELFSGYDRVAQRILIDKLLSLNIVGFIKEWFA